MFLQQLPNPNIYLNENQPHCLPCGGHIVFEHARTYGHARLQNLYSIIIGFRILQSSYIVFLFSLLYTLLRIGQECRSFTRRM